MALAVLLSLCVSPAAASVAPSAVGSSPAAPELAEPTAAPAPTPTLAVVLSSDGDAQVALTLTYNLSDDAETRGFERLRRNESELARPFAEQFTRLAEQTANATGRSMRVSDPSAKFSTAADGTVGVVVLSVTWTNLARVEGDRVVLSEPFENGFQPDRRFVVRGPDGYALSSSTHEPAITDDARTVWNARTRLEGFQVAFAPRGDGSSGPFPVGSGPIVGVIGLLGAAVALGAFARLRG